MAVPGGVTRAEATATAWAGASCSTADGTWVTSHTGPLDGFGTYMGFLPELDLGLVVLTNIEPPTGGAWMNLVLEQLLRQRLGLDVGGGPAMMAQAAQPVADLKAVGRDAVALNRKDVEPQPSYKRKTCAVAAGETGGHLWRSETIIVSAPTAGSDLGSCHRRLTPGRTP